MIRRQATKQKMGAAATSSQSRSSRPDEFSSVIESARWYAAHCPDRIAYTFLSNGEDQCENLTFAELDRDARSIAARLQTHGKVGDRALVVYDTGLEFIKALIGVLYAGMVAVPTPPLDILRWDITLDRIQRITRDAKPQMLLSTSYNLSRVSETAATELTGVQIATDRLDEDEQLAWKPPHLDPNHLAILQYTSGSTGTPRGVMLSHGNLMFNFQSLVIFDEPGAVGVSWLPLHHDMGLLGAVIPMIQGGRRLVLMSPQQFVERPLRWLQAISRFGAYMTGGPNFAYDLCVKKISEAERDTLDLSCWTVAANGAEPIRASTLRRFAAYFEPCGFRMSTFCPCYGLAELTLYVTRVEKQMGPTIHKFDKRKLREGRAFLLHGQQDGKTLVGSGTPAAGLDVRIVAPDTETECAEGELGEIWIAGPGRAQGYWNLTAESARCFEARLKGGNGQLYCRTGDQGFLFEDELFVTGRLNDKIIFHGQNYYPDDIEHTVEESHPYLLDGRSVAIAIEDGDTEQLVVVAETRKPQTFDPEQLIQTIRSRVAVEHQLQCHAVVLVTAASLPRTTSGKKQRYLVREMFQENRLSQLAAWRDVPPPEETRDRVPARGNTDGFVTGAASKQQLLAESREVLARLSRVPPSCISPDTLLSGDLGLASIDFIAFHEQVENVVGHQLELAELMSHLGLLNRTDLSLEQYIDYVLDRLHTIPPRED